MLTIGSGFIEGIVPRDRKKAEIDLSDRGRYAFRHYVDLNNREEVLRTGARYLILHKDLREEAFLKYRVPSPDIGPLIALFSEDFGAPVFEDEVVIAYRIQAASGPDAEGGERVAFGWARDPESASR